MSHKVTIDGFNVIAPPPSDKKILPGVLTEEDLAHFTEVRFFESFLSFDDYATHIILLQSYLQELTNQGQNVERYGLEDCNIAIINTRDDGQVPTYVEDGAAIVVQSKATQRYQIFDLIMPVSSDQATFQANNSRNTAREIVDMCRGTAGNVPVE